MDREGLKKAEFENEGFPVVYAWFDDPDTIYPLHTHQDKVAMFITRGELTFDFSGEKKHVRAGERFDVPPLTPHTAVVGPEGCGYVVGQMTPDDA